MMFEREAGALGGASLNGGQEPFVDPFAAQAQKDAGRRMRALDLFALTLLALACGGVAVNALMFQPRSQAVLAPQPKVAAPAEKPPVEKPKAVKTVSVPTAAPTPAPAPSQPAPQQTGQPEGSLGYLAMKSTMSVSAPVKPPSPAPAAPAAAAAPRQPVQPAAMAARRPSGVDADITGAVRPPADVATTTRILSVQKALARLGYGPIRLDGKPGLETKLAIQKFERDRRLPVDGQISERVVRELAAVSGQTLE